MKNIILRGDIKKIIPRAGGGLTGEVHILKRGKKKYILRRCGSVKTAKHYIKIYNKFKKYGFLPKLLGRYGNDVVFEYVEGRHLRKGDPLKYFEEIGRIAARVNKHKARYDYKKVFYQQLKEVETGKYKNTSPKVLERRRRNKEEIRPKKVFIKKEVEDIRKTFNLLDKKCSPKTVWDANDFGASNFIIDKKGKVFFVDIEGIKPKVKGFAIGKGILHLAKKKSQKKALIRGYSSVLSNKFLTDEYIDFLFLSFLMQKINYRFKIYKSSEYEIPVRKLMKIVKKYA